MIGNIIILVTLSFIFTLLLCVVGSKWTASKDGLDNCNTDASWGSSCRFVVPCTYLFLSLFLDCVYYLFKMPVYFRSIIKVYFNFSQTNSWCVH